MVQNLGLLSLAATTTTSAVPHLLLLLVMLSLHAQELRLCNHLVPSMLATGCVLSVSNSGLCEGQIVCFEAPDLSRKELLLLCPSCCTAVGFALPRTTSSSNTLIAQQSTSMLYAVRYYSPCREALLLDRKSMGSRRSYFPVKALL